MALPLKIYEDLSAFKLYTLNIGLLGAIVDTAPEQVLLRNDIFTEFKGGMAEQYVLQELISHKIFHNERRCDKMPNSCVALELFPHT